MSRPFRTSALMTATAIGLCGAALAGCEPKPVAQPAPPPPEAAAAVKIRPPPLPPAPLGRQALLDAIAAARSAYAAGQPDPDADLAGQRFALRQAFGCSGPSPGDAPAQGKDGVASWSWGRDKESIELSLTPADLAAAPVIMAAGSPWEAVEGYWLTRPWLRTDDCPALPPAPATPAAAAAAADAADAADADPKAPPIVKPPGSPAPQDSGLAAVFARDSSRVSRRDGRAFALTVRGDAPLASPTNGYRLVIEGRLSAFPDGRAIQCQSVSIDRPPVCIAAAEVDRVAFEDAEGKLLKEWRLG